jgi:acyl carrier protein
MSDADTIKSEVFAAVHALLEDKSLTVADDTPLIGGESLLDSMKLVELCLSLEDKASDLGFEFDWTSDVAMSRSRSMFRTAGSLAAEFLQQRDAQK